MLTCPVLAADQNWNVVPLCPDIPGQEYLYVIRQRVGAVHHSCMVDCWGCSPLCRLSVVVQLCRPVAAACE